MTLSALPEELPRMLRKAGLEVVVIDNWLGRRRPGSFSPVGVLNHHTGSSARGWSLDKELAYARWMFLSGRSDLPAPLVQLALGRSGRVYVGAAGRSNHAGTAQASGSVAGGDGNRLYVGIEWMLSGFEVIPPEMRKAGVTLNAVLTEKVTRTSVRSISCHFQTSVTGKWDIGDPQGVMFKGHKVLDVEKFRKAVQAERARLFKPARRPHNGYTCKVAHASMRFANTPEQWRHNAEAIFSRGYEWVTGTEAGQTKNWQALASTAKKYGYTIKRYKSNWIAVSKKVVKPGSLKWGRQTVVDSSKTAGRSFDPNYIFCTFEHTEEGVGTISVVGSHYPTKGKPDAKRPGMRVNLRWTKLMGQEISKKIADLGDGAALAFYGGDQNISDKHNDTFFGGPVTTCWDEIKKWPNTGHGNIDVIASYDRDTRVSCIGARAFDDKALFLYSDHYLIEATYRIERRIA